MTIAERYGLVGERVAKAAARAGRRAGEITIVAVAKSFPAADVAAALEAGAHDVGESYVQEARAKREELESPSSIRWHLVGRLQRNKVHVAVAVFDLVHSLDSVPLARALDRAARQAGRVLPCLVEVKLVAEPSKGGVPAEELPSFLESLAGLEGLSIRGLMTIPPAVDDAERSRPHFRRLRELSDRLQGLRLPGVQLKELSMGMSGDFEVAVEEGATLARIGTAIFGARERER